MVEPCALAETVTPASFSPDADATVPLSRCSAACAASGNARPAAKSAANPNRHIFMALLLVRACSTGGGRRYGFQVRDDGVDLAAIEVVLERGHARRALADQPADDLVAAAGGLLGEGRTIGAGIDCGRQVADPAGLRNQLAAVSLDIGEIIAGAGLLGERALRPSREHEHESGGAARHANPPDIALFLEVYAGPMASGRMSARIGWLDRHAPDEEPA